MVVEVTIETVVPCRVVRGIMAWWRGCALTRWAECELPMIWLLRLLGMIRRYWLWIVDCRLLLPLHAVLLMSITISLR